MSFVKDIFGGANNNFQPQGQAIAQNQANTANINYGAANTGLNSLATMLQNQANGQGPNPALAQLQQTTGQNIAGQASLMAGQRGASANPGLMARQIANQGAAIQQQSVGQSAVQRAQQQLAAQGQLGQVYGTQGSLANQNYGIAQGGVNQGNQIGAQTAGQNAGMNQGLIGGAANVIGGITGLFAEGGEAEPQALPGFSTGSNFGFNFVNGHKPGNKDPMVGATNAIQSPIPGGNQYAGGDQPQMPVAANGGEAETLPFAPQTTKPMGAMMMAPGGVIDAKRGGTIPGEPKHNYNTVKNDVVPAMLTPKEIVLPIEVTQAADAPQKAANFVAAELQKHGHGDNKKDFKGALKRGIAARKKK